jgi:hypothetical protein
MLRMVLVGPAVLLAAVLNDLPEVGLFLGGFDFWSFSLRLESGSAGSVRR